MRGSASFSPEKAASGKKKKYLKKLLTKYLVFDIISFAA
jgi:hypothetical protein